MIAVAGSCPSCDRPLGVASGQLVPTHYYRGTLALCPGSSGRAR